MQISRNWPGVAWHLLLELQWFNPDINGKQGVIGGPKRHGHIGGQRPGVFNEERWSILVSVSVLPLTWEWPEFAPKRWRSMAHDGSMRRMWGKKWAQKGSTSHTHWLFFSSRNTMSPSRQLTIYMDDESMHLFYYKHLLTEISQNCSRVDFGVWGKTTLWGSIEGQKLRVRFFFWKNDVSYWPFHSKIVI